MPGEPSARTLSCGGVVRAAHGRWPSGDGSGRRSGLGPLLALRTTGSSATGSSGRARRRPGGGGRAFVSSRGGGGVRPERRSLFFPIPGRITQRLLSHVKDFWCPSRPTTPLRPRHRCTVTARKGGGVFLTLFSPRCVPGVRDGGCPLAWNEMSAAGAPEEDRRRRRLILPRRRRRLNLVGAAGASDCRGRYGDGDGRSGRLSSWSICRGELKPFATWATARCGGRYRALSVWMPPGAEWSRPRCSSSFTRRVGSNAIRAVLGVPPARRLPVWCFRRT